MKPVIEHIPLTQNRELLEKEIRHRVSQLSVSESSISLVKGKSGLVLLYAYLYQEFEEDVFFETYSALLEECLTQITKNPVDTTLSAGVGGLMWVIQHLINQELIDRENEAVLEKIETFLIDSFAPDEQNYNYDLLHGLIGKGLYFLESAHKPTSRQVLRRIVDTLYRWQIQMPAGVAWIDYDFGQRYDPESKVLNLGMAHGIPSIISFLSRVYALSIEKEQTGNLITLSVQWLITQSKSVGFSQFSTIAGIDRESRLAWCYGDLGPATAVLHAAQAMQNRLWYENAITIALQAAQRTLETAKVYQQSPAQVDTGFCHGSSGLSHIFFRLYQQTHRMEFLKASDYWLQQMQACPPAPVLFPYIDEATQHMQWKEDHSLLTGLAGTIQVLLSRVNPTYTDWDLIFMTSVF